MATNKRVFLIAFVLFAVLNVIDFLFYGQELRNLVGATGFSLMAYSYHKNARALSIVGAVLALGSIIVKYVP